MLPMPIFADPDDPNEDPGMLLLYSAQNGWIEGMEKAMSNNPKVLFSCDTFDHMSALHLAAASTMPKAVDSVRWLLKKGIPWCVRDVEGRLPEEWAKVLKNEESRTLLRNWAIDTEYETFYREENNRSSFLRLQKNIIFCNSVVQYLNPPGAPEDEVALVSGSKATGVMMEWERPIMRETARLLLDGMPTTGLRVLNIGFGIGMIDTYFQDAQPAEHVIIEGHPTCLEWMRRKGWYDRPGVRILEGRWQDFFPSESLVAGTNQTPKDGLSTLHRNLLQIGQRPSENNMVDIGKFDVVYFDTFEEGYLGHFNFIKTVPWLLRGPNSRFSYFIGHGAKEEVSQQVFMEVARLHHNDLGMSTTYFPVDVDPTTIWYNLRDHDKGAILREPGQFIPICALAPTVPRRIVPVVGYKNNRLPET